MDKLTARSPEDLLAVVPVVLGFWPTDSVVMLTFGAPRTFHARVDLPPDRAEIELVVESLLGPARHHRVESVVFLLFSDDDRLPAQLAKRLDRAFAREGIRVVELLRADGRRWYPLRAGRRSWGADGVPYDVTRHPFLVGAVVDGQVTHASRAALAATLERDDAAVERTAAGVAALTARPPETHRWLVATVRHHVAERTAPGDDDAARVLRSLGQVAARDALWALIDRPGADAHAAFWTGLLRRAPDDLAAPAASLLGFAAWLGGHGALAWCAVDRALAAHPGYSLAVLIGQLLEGAVPPHAWESTRTPA